MFLTNEMERLYQCVSKQLLKTYVLVIHHKPPFNSNDINNHFNHCLQDVNGILSEQVFTEKYQKKLRRRIRVLPNISDGA